jgi:hypothetical protein
MVAQPAPETQIPKNSRPLDTMEKGYIGDSPIWSGSISEMAIPVNQNLSSNCSTVFLSAFITISKFQNGSELVVVPFASSRSGETSGIQI